MATKVKRKIRVFFSYAHKDEELRKELQKHLTTLRHEGLIEEWNDREITGGTDWKNAIAANLEQADLVLLLISSDFLASGYIYDVELKLALKKHDAETARVVPIILRPCLWRTADFARLQALPRDGKPVVGEGWHDQDTAFTNVAEGLRRVVGELQDRGSNETLAEVSRAEQEAREALRRIRNHAARALQSIVGEVESLEGSLSMRVRSENSLDRAGAIVDALISLSAREMIGLLVEVVRSDEGRPKSSEEFVRAIREVCQHLLPVVFRVEDAEKIRDALEGQSLIAVPAYNFSVVEILMAGVDRRKLRFDPPKGRREFPPGRSVIQMPPEMGIDGDGDRFIEAFERHLRDSIIPPGVLSDRQTQFPGLVDDFLKDILRHDHYRYYFVYECGLSKESRSGKESVIGKLRERYPRIVFIATEPSDNPREDFVVLDRLNRILCHAAGIDDR